MNESEIEKLSLDHKKYSINNSTDLLYISLGFSVPVFCKPNN